MNDCDFIKRTISSLLTEKALKEKRDDKSNETIMQMNELIKTIIQQKNEASNDIEKEVKILKKKEKEHKLSEEKIKRELIELHKSGRIKQIAFIEMLSIFEMN